jgi:hypothetical protein
MPKLLMGRLPIATPEYNQYMQDDLVRSLEQILRSIDTDAFRLGLNNTPSTASDTGTRGDVSYDSDYIYICTDTDTWKRATLSTW